MFTMFRDACRAIRDFIAGKVLGLRVGITAPMLACQKRREY